MDKEFLEFIIEHFECVPGGSKEACIKVRQFIGNAIVDEEGRLIPSLNSAVSSEEFLEAVRVLMAFAWQNREQDTVPERFICDSDCTQIGDFCLGECQLVSKRHSEYGKVKSKQCPYYRDSCNI